MSSSADMLPTTSNFNFARQAGPSSPPQTPINSTFTFKNRRNGMHFSHTTLPTRDATITPNGNGPNFSYTPSTRPEDLSPRSSSSPGSSVHSSSSGSLARSLSSSPAAPTSESPPQISTRVVTEGNFELEEFGDSDYEEWESGDEEVIRPTQYEDAESDPALSVKSAGRNELDSRILSGFKNLKCENEEDAREAWVKQNRAAKKWKRRSSGSVQKRTLSQSIGSDTDDEDLQPVTFEGANEAGSSARRLRRKVKGERTSLIFDDPPPRIDEVDEGPESCEELIEVDEAEAEDDDDDDGNGQCVDRELPYFRYVQEMDVDSDEE